MLATWLATGRKRYGEPIYSPTFELNLTLGHSLHGWKHSFHIRRRSGHSTATVHRGLHYNLTRVFPQLIHREVAQTLWTVTDTSFLLCNYALIADTG
jgi:hypothetical protein